MADEYNVLDKTFSELKRLAMSIPFEPFRVRPEGMEVPIDHPNCIGFHREVPFLTLHSRADISRLGMESVTLLRESHGP